MKKELKLLLSGLLFAACTNVPQDDGTLPPPLYSQPQSAKANPEGGYITNRVTNDTIEPIINSFGDTLVTGMPIPVIGKFIHPDSVAKPKKIKAPSLESLEKHDAHPNRSEVPKELITVAVNTDSLTRIPLGQVAKDDTLHYILSSIGDTIPTGRHLALEGTVVKARHRKPVIALPSRFQDDATINMQYLDVDQGMNSSRIRTVLEDKNGLIWFGTYGGGASVYNGESFTHFTEEEGLSNNDVMSIIEDEKGHIWFGTYGGGISVYNGDSFTHFTEKEGLSHNYIRSLLKDRNGNIWIATFGGGVSIYDGTGFTHITEKEGLSHNEVLSILEDKNGDIWFGTFGGGANLYDGESFTHFTERDGLSHDIVTSMLEDKSGNIWFGGGNGVAAYNGESFTYFTQEEGLSSNIVLSILEDKTGNIWFGTDGGGVNVYDGETFRYFTKKEGLVHNTVRTLYEGKNGLLWFGTGGGGVSIYNKDSFYHLTENDGLSNNIVKSVIEDKNGLLWFGTSGGGVDIYNGENLAYLTEKEGLSSNYIASFLKDKNEHLWLGTDEGGVTLYDGDDFTHFTMNEGLSYNVVVSILADEKGNIWFGTFGGGATLYNGENFTHFTEKEGFSDNYVLSTLEDKNGNIWFGTYGGGVSSYNGQTFTHFTQKEGLSNNIVTSILEDKNGNIWFGTEGGGLSIYNGESFTYITEKEGLSNNRVWSILENDRDIWVSTENGLTLFEFDRKTKINESQSVEKGIIGNYSIKNYFKQDGLKGLDFFPNSAFEDSRNHAYWGNGKSLTMLNLNRFSTSKTPPSINLLHFEINGQFLDYRNSSDSLSDYIKFDQVQPFYNLPLNLELPYHQNHLTFHFAGIDWNAPHKIKYSYRLLGLNDNWSAPTEEAKAEYRNIPHGNFILQIRAIGESGEWSKPFEYTFTIHPPWWHTIYARVGYGILGILLILGMVRWRTNKLKTRQQELEVEVELATKEIRQQKELVEEKNTEILDSINYAKRIQSAILPPGKLVKEYLPDSFILYKPKDVVAGDFYWMEHKNDTILFAAADCTGHGVPGAMVSVVCNNGLNRATREHGLIDPGMILDKTREIVIQEFEKSEEDVKDGMDISLCALDVKTNTLHWAGANNPLWIIRNGEILETKPDKQPIGKRDYQEPFTTHSIGLRKEDSIYVFTDGFQDQFGGENGKKFKTSNFKKLLLSIQNEPMERQREIIDKTFEDWKGNLEQLDDVCVIGVRL